MNTAARIAKLEQAQPAANESRELTAERTAELEQIIARTMAEQAWSRETFNEWTYWQLQLQPQSKHHLMTRGGFTEQRYAEHLAQCEQRFKAALERQGGRT